MKKTIVAFHIGRGGRFYNAGFLTFIGEKEIGEFTDDLFTRFENESDLLEEIEDEDRFRDLCTDENFTLLEEEFEESEHDDFEEFMNNVHDNVLCERVFVDEVYV